MGDPIIKGQDELSFVHFLIKRFQEDNDISHLLLAGCHLRQSIEFFVKGSILLLGSPYREGHRLRPNIRLLLELTGSDRQLPESLLRIVRKFERPLSAIDNEYIYDLNSWGTGGYDTDSEIDIDLKIINKILPLAEELQEAASKLDKGGSAS